MLKKANIVGAGPNGLAAAITLARAGVRVVVYERMARAGGACGTEELTLPGFRHDVGSSVYPLGVASPFFRTLPLEKHGLRWVQPEAGLGHPFDDATGLTLERNIDDTCAQLGAQDAKAWKQLMSPLIENWDVLVEQVMSPLGRVPRHPVKLAAFFAHAAMPAVALGKMLFKDERTRALLGGNAAHSVLPLTHVGSAGAGLVLAAAAHTTGWPVAEGGAQSLTNALVGYLGTLGGEVRCGVDVQSMEEMEPAEVTLFDTSPRAMMAIAESASEQRTVNSEQERQQQKRRRAEGNGPAISASFATRLKHFDYGPGAFKVDWALSQPIPWSAKEMLRAGTVHLGGSMAEIAASEAAAFDGKLCDKPYVLLVQPSLFDATRAPEGKHTAWAYCHVPNGDGRDLTAILEAQVERFAPGFKDCVLARAVRSPAAFEAWNPNMVGGDISGGAMTLPQLLARPTLRLWRTSSAAMYLCSSSTPPGGGVHGMCGYLAAKAALADRA